jgi:hypothetical protein
LLPPRSFRCIRWARAYASPSDYESGGQEFESLRARQINYRFQNESLCGVRGAFPSFSVKQMLESRAAAGGAVIEGTAEPVGMLGPAELEQPQRKRPNRLLEHVDTAVAPKERKPRKRVPSPWGA